jgi:hypothetical protein
MATQPWQSVPKQHQLALKSANIMSLLPQGNQAGQLQGETPALSSPSNYNSSFDLAAKYAQMDAQVNHTNEMKLKSSGNFHAPAIATNKSPLQERVHPHMIKTLARSGVRAPGFSGGEGMNASPTTLDSASTGLSNVVRQNAASLGKV